MPQKRKFDYGDMYNLTLAKKLAKAIDGNAWMLMRRAIELKERLEAS